MHRFLLFLSLWLPLLSFSQADGNIQITANFETVLSLRLEETNILWEFKSLSQYEDGYWPVERIVPFRVSSSHNWGLQVEFSKFKNTASEDTINLRNFTVRVHCQDKNDWKRRVDFPSAPRENANSVLSGIYVGGSGPMTVLIPGPEGNAGDFDNNYFKFRIGLGRWTDYTGMPPILDQRIAPGTYTGTLTVTAYSDFNTL